MYFGLTMSCSTLLCILGLNHNSDIISSCSSILLAACNCNAPEFTHLTTSAGTAKEIHLLMQLLRMSLLHRSLEHRKIKCLTGILTHLNHSNHPDSLNFLDHNNDFPTLSVLKDFLSRR